MIGTAELLADRVYETPHSPEYPVIVKAGIYHVDWIETTQKIFLHLTGYRLRSIGFEKLWKVDVIPHLWNEEEFWNFCAEDICKEGHSQQRWKIQLSENLTMEGLKGASKR